jgi:hypothetical protein
MNRASWLFCLLCFLCLWSSCTFPSDRKLQSPWKDGPRPICAVPAPDVIVKAAQVNADVAAGKVGTLLKGTRGVGLDIERIRQEVPNNVAAFAEIDWRLCVQYGNQILTKAEYQAFTKQIIPGINHQTLETPKSKELFPQPSLLAPCHQSTTKLKRQPRMFFLAWRSTLERLRNERHTYDLQNLFEIWGRVPIGLTGRDLIREATYTLKCLEEDGLLKMEKMGTTSMSWGENFENHLITFRNR